MARKVRFFFWLGGAIVLSFCFHTPPAYANAGTTLMWATITHLLIGNLVLGLGEGEFLRRRYQLPRWLTMIVMVLANYTSTWGGILGLTAFAMSDQAVGLRRSFTIFNIGSWLWIFYVFMFILTLALEFPFIAVLFWKRGQSLRRAAIATLIVHLISYTVLLGWYNLASVTSLIRKVTIVPVAALNLPSNYELYYVSPDGTTVYQSDLAGTAPQVVMTGDFRTESGDSEALSLRAHNLQQLQEGFDLVIGDQLLRTQVTNHLPSVPIDYVDRVVQFSTPELSESGEYRVPYGGEVIPRLGVVTSDWIYGTSHWAAGGLWMSLSAELDRRDHFAIETPVSFWYIRHAIQIAGDFVVFQLGYDQICIMQPQLRVMSLVARGQNPMVILR